MDGWALSRWGGWGVVPLSLDRHMVTQTPESSKTMHIQYLSISSYKERGGGPAEITPRACEDFSSALCGQLILVQFQEGLPPFQITMQGSLHYWHCHSVQLQTKLNLQCLSVGLMGGPGPCSCVLCPQCSPATICLYIPIEFPKHPKPVSSPSLLLSDTATLGQNLGPPFCMH
jgi:hypothetical protein